MFCDEPLARYVKLWVAHAPGMPGTFSPTPRVSDTDMHHGLCVTHVPWCTNGYFCSLWRGNRSQHYRRMHSPQFYVSSKRPMAQPRVNYSREQDKPGKRGPGEGIRNRRYPVCTFSLIKLWWWRVVKMVLEIICKHFMIQLSAILTLSHVQYIPRNMNTVLLCFVCCGYAIIHNEFTWSIYPYSSGFLCWHWGNR